MPELKRPSLPLTGGCPCGAIRFEVTAFPLLLYACHCTECQRRTGSSFALNMPVATAALRVIAGAPKSWEHLSPTGIRTTSWFCGDCGGRIYGTRHRPEAVTVRAGTLDDTSWLWPAAHIFMRSAQPWEQIAGDAECYETSPSDFRPLAMKWRQLREAD